MIKSVPFLTKEYIERDAAALLAEYAQETRITIAPPIPVEDIIEKHLKLTIEFVDTHRLFNIPRYVLEPDILGAIFFEESRIVIDESLDPEEYPYKEGRYRFTLGHEGCGHWRLHRHLFTKNPALYTVFPLPVAPSVICRSSQARERVEWQADFYASCLLMPPYLVFDEWNKKYPGGSSRLIQPSMPVSHPFVEVPFEIIWGDHGDERYETADEALDRIARPLAEVFLVSTTAMRIRLENLGLLLRDVPYQRIRTVRG